MGGRTPTLPNHQQTWAPETSSSYITKAFVLAQYGQRDGYPDGQGFTILVFLQTPLNIERLKAGLAHIYIATEEELGSIHAKLDKAERTDRQAAEEAGNVMAASYFPRGDALARIYPLSRDTGAKILEIVAQATAEKRVPVELDEEFVHDILSCEWAYVVDIDAELLEVNCSVEPEYDGTSERFEGVHGAEKGMVPSLIRTLTFSDLATLSKSEFIRAHEPES
ncbi:hypothetical protein O988_00373 [Pseudogymnoascus sp. VKM F-3808]|nr:hypothetical protein O988_00373 [Pseudogymnoascus sp. VKM F-3808]